MHVYLLAFSAGAIVLHFTSWLPALSQTFLKLFLVCCVCALLALWRVSLRAGKSQGTICAGIVLCLFVSSYIFAALEVVSIKQDRISHAQLGDRKVLFGSVCSIPRFARHYVRFDVCAHEDSEVPRGKYRVTANLKNYPKLTSDCLRLELTLKPPRSSHNAWLDGYERHLFSNRILGLGYVKSIQSVSCSFEKPWLAKITSWRRNVHAHLESLIGGHPQKGLIYALVIGERGDIDGYASDVLRESGTQHLIAISGLHVGLICWAVYACLLRLRLNAYAIPVLCIVGAAYIVMVGFSASAQRAFVMLLCGLYFLLGRAPPRSGQAFLIALCAVLLIDPLAPLNPGFWFSFVAVAVLLVMFACWPSLVNGSAIRALLMMQILITVSLVLVQASFAMPTSVFAILANFVAISWVSVVVLPICLIAVALSYAGLDSVAIGLFEGAGLVLDALISFCSLALDIDHRFFSPTGNVELLLLVLALMLMLLLGLVRRLAFLLLAGISMYMLIPPAAVLDRSDAALVVLDVGQGLSIYAGLGGRHLVYDTGPALERFSVAKQSLRPLLHKMGVSNLDYLVLSHGDADHASDAHWVEDRFRPKAVIAGEIERLNLGSDVVPCHAGQKWEGGGLSARVIWPVEGWVAGSSNNRSCVLMLQLNSIRVLLMGDLEGKGERAMLHWYAEQGRLPELKSDVLVAGHHGAKAATSFTLLKHVAPSYIVFSSGYANRFGHPAREVLNRAEKMDAIILSTAHNGAIEFRFSSVGDIGVVRSREVSSQYWVEPTLTF